MNIDDLTPEEIRTIGVTAGAFADLVAGVLIDGAPHPPRDDIERRTRVCDLLEIAANVFDGRGDTSTAETIRQHAYAIAPPYVADRIRRKAAERDPAVCSCASGRGVRDCPIHKDDPL